MAIDRLINSTQGDSIIAALGSSGSIAQSLAIIAAKSNTPYNSDNKLNPSFIAYDTTHAAVTEAQRTQIGTNTTNIIWNTNNGVKNYLPINSGVTTGSQYVFDWIAKDIPAGQYIISFSTETASGAVAIEFGDSNTSSYNQTGYRVITLPAQSAEVTVEANTHYVRIFANVALTITDIMLRPASISDASYQPYALSNATITPALKECVNNGVKNLVDVPDITISASGGGYVTANNNVVLPAGKYVIILKATATSGNILTSFKDSGGNTIGSLELTMNGGQIKGTIFLSAQSSYFNAFANQPTTVTKYMVIAEAMYDAGFTDYQPYAMSNVDLTPHTINVIKNNFTATDWTKVDELAFEIPTGKIAEFSASATRDTNIHVVGIAFVNDDTFSIDKVLAISENANENYYALAVCGIRSRKNLASETVNVFVKYSAAPVSSNITCTYRFV